MTPTILNLNQAAKLLQLSPEGLRVKINKGEIPASKIGKRWILILSDIVTHIRSGYAKTAKTSWSVDIKQRRNICHSTKEVISGGLISRTVEKEYNKLLGHPTAN